MDLPVNEDLPHVHPPPRQGQRAGFGLLTPWFVGLAGGYLLFSVLNTLVMQGGNDAISTLVATVTFPFSVALVVVGSIWFYRAGQYADQLGAEERRWSPVWGVLGWIIPVANILIPYLYTREVWKASDPKAGPHDWQRVAAPSWLHLWWAFWGGTQVLALVGGVAGFLVGVRHAAEAAAAGTAPGPVAIPGWLLAIAWMQLALMALAYPLFVKLLYALQERQKERAQRLAALQQKAARTPPTGTF